MGTVSVRMPDEEIKKLEELAEKEGKSRSALMRELAEEKIEEERNAFSAMEELVGILSDEEAERFKEAVEEARSEMTESFERSVEKKWENRRE